ncbi:MAG TPA: VOC family protein, partial [Erysipelotrichaceae bacterium]|nr:VOC family protein [Erysipelotrichaceae bacterium]
MEFKSIMHVSFYVEDIEKSLEFYCGKLGLKQKILTRYSAYKDSNKPHMKKMAEERPNDIFLTYVEIAPG